MSLPRLLRQFHLSRVIPGQAAQRFCSFPLGRTPLLRAVQGDHQTNVIKRWKADDRRELIGSMPKKDMGTHGESGVDIDLLAKK